MNDEPYYPSLLRASYQPVPEVPVLEYFNSPAQQWHYDFARRVADALPSYPGFEARVAAGGIEEYDDEDGNRVEVDLRNTAELCLEGPTEDGRRFMSFSRWTREFVQDAAVDLLEYAHSRWQERLQLALVG